MRILGIDPGLAIVGYGVIEKENSKLKMIDYGAIYTYPEQSFPERISYVYEGVIQLINHFNPDVVAFEELFFNTNVKTAINVAHARGAALCAAYNMKKELYEYTPLQIKQAVVGYGRADKNQIQSMVKMLLNLDKIPKPDDAADGLAVAICHANSIAFKDTFKIK